MRSRPSTTQVDDDKTSLVSSPTRNEARVFCRPTIFPRPATTPRTRHVSSCAPRVVRASAVERFGSPEGSRDPRVLGRRVCSRNPASFKRDAHAPWRRRTGPPWGRPASAPPRRHGPPMTGGRFQTDDAFGRDSGSNAGSARARTPARWGRRLPRRARSRSRPRSAHVGGSDYAPLLFGASPGPWAASPARGTEHAAGAYGDASLHTPGPAARRTPGFFGAGSGRDAPGAVRPGTGERDPAAGSRRRRDRRGRERRFRARALTSLTAAQRYEPRGTPRGRHARGHVSTPWADRSAGAAQAAGSGDGAPTRGPAAATDVPNAISESVKTNGRGVRFRPRPGAQRRAFEFQKDGDVEARRAAREADANSHVRFADAASARRALRRNGRRAAGDGGRSAAGRAVARKLRDRRRRGAGAHASSRRLGSRPAYAGRIRSRRIIRARGRRGDASSRRTAGARRATAWRSSRGARSGTRSLSSCSGAERSDRGEARADCADDEETSIFLL